MLKGKNDNTVTPKIVCILETEPPKVLAYRIIGDNISASIRLVIYDALVSTRRPATLVPAGLEWGIPTQFYTEVGLDDEVGYLIREHLQVQIQQDVIQSHLVNALRGNWDVDLTNRVMGQDHFDRVFDNYLHRIHGYGPRRVQADLTEKYKSLVGYSTVFRVTLVTAGI
ncbi:MAG: hypothetical protein JW953_20495 [Anaerolineae bacterium]|nr:hypothetical protein [Anaerolineae bacterium]